MGGETICHDTRLRPNTRTHTLPRPKTPTKPRVGQRFPAQARTTEGRGYIGYTGILGWTQGQLFRTTNEATQTTKQTCGMAQRPLNNNGRVLAPRRARLYAPQGKTNNAVYQYQICTYNRPCGKGEFPKPPHEAATYNPSSGEGVKRRACLRLDALATNVLSEGPPTDPTNTICVAPFGSPPSCPHSEAPQKNEYLGPIAKTPPLKSKEQGAAQTTRDI